MIQHSHDTYYLVSIVDNAFDNEKSDIFSIFERLITESMTVEEVREHARIMEKDNQVRVRVDVVSLSIWSVVVVFIPCGVLSRCLKGFNACQPLPPP